MKKIYQVALMVFLFIVTFAFSGIAQNSFFSDLGENSLVQTTKKRFITPEKFRTSKINIEGVKSFLKTLPNEENVKNNFKNAPIMELPMPDGSFAKFNVWESSVMAPELQAKFPEIRTYAGQGIDDPAATIRFDYNPYFGFSAQILSPNGRIYIDPYSRGDILNYISYYNKYNNKKHSLKCSVEEVGLNLNQTDPILTAGPCLGTQLRTYRLAVACTGEYSIAVAGGNASATLAAIVNSTNRITGVYEVELAVRLQLIGNNNLIVYTDPNTDPYTNVISGTLLNQNQTNIDAVIGFGNYDVGHVFTSDDNGLAQLNAVCGSGKARGATGSPVLVGDGFDIDYVAHELGHQFGGSHTFNSASCASAGGSYEPGGGTTIMAYAGICAANENIQPNSDPIFHAFSFDQIGTFISTGGGSTCATITSTGNILPIINTTTATNFSIPINTPFVLNGTASDANGDAISYNWEGWDVGAAGTWVSAGTSTTRPLFRTRVSKTIGQRVFPDIRVIVANYPGTGAPSQMDGLRGEVLPQVARTMKFRLTVRDNRAGGGGVVSAGEGCQTAAPVEVIAVGTTAFALTSPNGGESYPGGSTQTITWNNANTTASPFNVANVNILFSNDGGLTYPTTLLANTPNDGSQAVNMPSGATTTARIKVEAAGNIFFDISNGNFNITAATNGFDLGTPAPVNVNCPAPASMDISLTTSQVGTFTNPISFTATGNPGGTTVTFNPVSVTANNPVTVTLNGTNTLAPGTYPIQVTGSASGASNVVRTLTYIINATGGPAVTLQPTSQTICSGANTSFAITSAAATSFQWQVSTNGGGTWTPLSNNATYSGVTTATLNITGATSTLNNYQYRCVASIQCGSTNSSAAVLTVNSAPAIGTQPQSATVCANNTINFSVDATGAGISYQWQLSTDGGANYNNLANGAPYSGVTTTTLTVSPTTAGMNGYRYRCVVTGTCTPFVNSSDAVLTIVTSVNVTTQPNNSTVCEGAGTSFTAGGSGAGVIYQWQISTDGGTNYTNLSNTAPYSGVTTATLTISTTTFAMNNYRYRCSMTNATCSNPGISNGAILTINTLPTLTSSPNSITSCLGSTVNFSAAGTGTALAYQWQVSIDGGANYTNLANGAPYSGVNTTTLTVAPIASAMNNYRYRCVLSGTCTPAVNSNAATLNVVNPVNITAQPTNKTVCATLNTSFSVTATSTETITYQWQVSVDGVAPYNNVPNGGVYSGVTTPTLTITGALNSMNNYRYRVLTNNVTCATAAPSNVVILTVNALPVVTWPTTLANQCANATTYALTGGLPAGGTYKGPGVTGTNFDAASAGIGTKTLWYIYTNASGCTDSISKTIVVNPFPTLTLSAYSTHATPANTLSLLPGWTTTITATMSTGPNATYVWQYQPLGTTFTNPISNTTNNYLVNVDRLGKYTIVGTSDQGCTSTAASITIKDSASTKLFIYPSPNDGRFSVAYHYPNASIATPFTHNITVYSSLGKQMFTRKYSITQPWKNIPVDLRNASAGVYYIVVRDANGNKVVTGEVMVY
jgi:hypothetical protein